MARKKTTNPTKLLTHSVRTRVNDTVYNRLTKLVGTSDCHSLGEVARKILSREPITVFTKDVTLDVHMEQLAAIHKELNAIGVNINQVTRFFHGADTTAKKTFHALKIADQYKLVGAKVSPLLKVIEQLSSKWLQK